MCLTALLVLVFGVAIVAIVFAYSVKENRRLDNYFAKSCDNEPWMD